MERQIRAGQQIADQRLNIDPSILRRTRADQGLSVLPGNTSALYALFQHD